MEAKNVEALFESLVNLKDVKHVGRIIDVKLRLRVLLI